MALTSFLVVSQQSHGRYGFVSCVTLSNVTMFIQVSVRLPGESLELFV